MAGIKNIADIYKKQGEKRLREILSNDLRITEKFDAYRFSFEKNSKSYKIVFYGKNGKSPITVVDRTLSDLYESAIDYIENLPYDIKKSLPLRHRFGFSWFPTKSPLNTDYERRPKNGLILTDITIRDKNNDVAKQVTESEIFERWSKIFNTEYSAPIHAGKLDSMIIESLVSIAKNEETLHLLTENFDTKGYLNKISPNIEAMIFEGSDTLFKISQKEELTVSEKRSHMFDLLLMDILEHVENYNVLGIRCASNRVDESYIEAISEIFNDYVEKRGHSYLESAIQKPRFLEKNGKFNRKWIKNPKTRTILEKDSRYEYLFTVFLANFRKPKFPSGLLNESQVNRFNTKIEEIDKIIGDDYSFLEFTTIVKEEKEDLVQLSAKPADYSRAVNLMARFFDTERDAIVGKDPINVIVANCCQLTNRILEEAKMLMAANGHKCFLIHPKDHGLKSFGVDQDAVQRLMNSFVIENQEFFIGCSIIERHSLSYILRKIRPDYEPMTIKMEGNTDTIKKEIEGLSAIYTKPEGLMLSINVSPIKDLLRKHYVNSLESNSYKDFCKLTPPCVHPYWQDIKNSFDRYTYN
jgi:hypothetical protein